MQKVKWVTLDRTKAYELSVYATFGTTVRERVTVNDTVYENNSS